MLETKANARQTQYASCEDFQQIFDEDMRGLYMLSFLLTADREKAERCFVSGLEDAVDGNPVFKEWARSWARRAIIRNAVRIIEPLPVEGSSHADSAPVNIKSTSHSTEQQAEIAVVLELEPFERFVYVMSILEHYRDQDCSVLLNCSRKEVVAARARALLQIGNAMELRSEEPASQESQSSVLQLLVAPRLATPA
jgi:DNA-directed RNA polymerase specialized sigma24 family protein